MNREEFMNRGSPEPMSGCWLWTKACNEGGYGATVLDGRSMSAHRASWMLFRGPIPAGMFLCHKCDVRSCVNPDHLFIGTHKDNMADRKSKNRARAVASFGPEMAKSLVGNRFRVCVYFKTRKQIAKVDRCAEKLGMSRSQLIVDAVREQCQRDMRDMRGAK